jgi:pyruvate dehydrogenase E1 component beta subunit
MSTKTIREAITEALFQEMQRDSDVVLMGEDIRGGTGSTVPDVEAWGGVLGVTKGLWSEYGSDRVIDTPITESAILGMAAGAAMTGMRPVAELMFADFFGVCFDAIYNQASKFRYMFGGKATSPLVIRTMIGAGLRSAAQHSQSPYHIFTSVPGLKCVVPSNAYDAKGLLTQAIRDDDPVIFCEHKALYEDAMEVPDESYTIPFGEANFVRDGSDVSIVALGLMVNVAKKAAEMLAKQGIEAEILDPRTTSPFDIDSLVETVENTGRLIIIDESAARCGVAQDIAAIASQEAFGALRAPIRIITPPHTPVPFSSVLEDAWIPQADTVVEAALEITSRDG